MNEQEWLVCTDPMPMLEFLKDKASDRKLRLFACACCRRIWNMLTDERSRKAVEASEQYADGMISDEECSICREAAFDAHEDSEQSWATAAYNAACPGFPFQDFADFAGDAAAHCQYAIGSSSESSIQTALLRDIFGNPFRPVAIDPRWLTSNVVDLSRAIYDERAFEKMPILADALMDAGCDSEEIIAHCRGSGPHVRGCWVVDLLLEKE